MTIEEILKNQELSIYEKITALSNKTVNIPAWTGPNGLESQYDPKKHEVMDKQKYPDQVGPKGVVNVTRIPIDLQKLAVKRMTELMTGIPVKRIYESENDRQKEIAGVLEKILDKNRIDSFNIERLNMLFSGCEVVTLWYAVQQENDLYGIHSSLKLRCKNYSPTLGDELYPLFDEYGDMTAMSIAYTRKVGKKTVRFFDAYTDNMHVKYSDESGEWAELENEETTLGKIPCIYCHRPTPIWEDSSHIVNEMEWALSRNGNYLRENSKPIFAVYADQAIQYGDEKGPDEEGKAVMQYPAGSRAEFVTWQQATDNLKFYVAELRSLFFTQLQLPDWNYEKMSQQAMSGESRKQMFIDAQLKVKDESGRIYEMLDREMNVLRSFLHVMLPSGYAKDIDSLPCKQLITPFMIGDDKETIENLLLANGNKPLMSQRESIETYGKSDDVDQTLKEIGDESKADVFEPTL